MLIKLNKLNAKNIWINSQKLDVLSPFGHQQSKSVAQAIQHLGYVQIDTINVIERCHHHILYNRIPTYKRKHLHQAQSKDKTVFEYWTHALSYVPTRDYKYFVSQMNNINTSEGSWFGAVKKNEYTKVKKLLRQGPLSIRDIKDDQLKIKQHEWDSKKPSKRALQLGFYQGEFVICEREGMLKKYDLAKRHFNWTQKPKAVGADGYTDYIVDRALRSQGLISLDSICHLSPSLKKAVEINLNKRIKQNKLQEVFIEGSEKIKHWVEPETFEKKINTSELTHILSPFDPLVIQRKRLKLFFNYEHVFEAYVAKHKRKFGYFTLPVLIQNDIVALLDLKTDRQQNKLLIHNWVWLNKFKSKDNKKLIESQLDRFEKFQFGD